MADNDDGFLGGGTQFNKVGASALDRAASDAIPNTPPGLQPYQIRNGIIIAVIAIMLVALFFISDPGGVVHKQGRGGRPTQDKPSISTLDHR